MLDETMTAPAERWTVPDTLSIAEEMFCAEVACGTAQGVAAKIAGFTSEYSTGLLRKEKIVARIKGMLAERSASSGVMSKTWAELQFIYIIRDAIRGIPDEIDISTGVVVSPGLPKNRELAASALMNFCKLRGWIVDRKQSLAGKVDLNALTGTGQLEGLLDETLQTLSPEERTRIKELTDRPKRGKLPRQIQTVENVETT